MKTILFAAAATALAFVSTNATATTNLVGAAVTGSNGAAFWNTASAPHFETAFVQQPISHAMKPQSAVPEAATWVMMLCGFGMIGIGLRARGNTARRVVFA
jgi:hypothetical protein